jgi:hypothetical protein
MALGILQELTPGAFRAEIQATEAEVVLRTGGIVVRIWPEQMSVCAIYNRDLPGIYTTARSEADLRRVLTAVRDGGHLG